MIPSFLLRALNETLVRKLGEKTQTTPHISSLFFITRRVMLIVSKPRSACQHGSSAGYLPLVNACCGLRLQTMFRVPSGQTSLSSYRHGRETRRYGLGEFSRSDRPHGKTEDQLWSPVSTAASSMHENLSPRLSFAHDCLPELSAQPAQEITISGPLAESLRSVAESRGAVLKA